MVAVVVDVGREVVLLVVDGELYRLAMRAVAVAADGGAEVGGVGFPSGEGVVAVGDVVSLPSRSGTRRESRMAPYSVILAVRPFLLVRVKILACVRL